MPFIAYENHGRKRTGHPRVVLCATAEDGTIIDRVRYRLTIEGDLLLPSNQDELQRVLGFIERYDGERDSMEILGELRPEIAGKALDAWRASCRTSR